MKIYYLKLYGVNGRGYDQRKRKTVKGELGEYK